MAPSSPLQNKSRDIYREPDLAMDFNFPSVDLLSSPACGEPPGDFTADMNWDWLQAAPPNDPSTPSNPQWALGPPPGLPPSQAPPAPVYSTKPGAPALYGPGTGYHQQPPVQCRMLPISLPQLQPQLMYAQPAYASQHQPAYVSQHQPAYASQHQPAYVSQHQPAYASQHSRAHTPQHQPPHTSQHQPPHTSQHQLPHTSQHLLPDRPASRSVHMHVIPPTPVNEGKQRAERVET
ncbi:hypothetical protein FIBSPDRAFT_967814 [Athelia psychrophila]|uniref:Uncharacterized protein n=1 Tax=Athelia psychrophila TaxID=1759441 RepID=A0A167VAW7_9AGAM|nr:hypothetical protein FIBSPDRAFT_967814 [Fibularhizoctonia sp. CBS 109695]